MFLHVVQVTYIDKHKLELQFNNGIHKEIDLSSELDGEIFQPLKDNNYFKKVYLNKDTGTVEWPNGADFAPEFLYENGIEIKKSA